MRLWQAFCVMFALLSLCVANKPIKLSKFNITLGLFGVWTYLLYAITQFILGGIVFVNVFYGILLYASFIRIYDKEDYHIVGKVLLGVGIYNIVLILMQQYVFDPIYVANSGSFLQNDPMGSFCLKAIMGIFFAVIWGFYLGVVDKIKFKNLKLSIGKWKLDTLPASTVKFVLALAPLYPLYYARSTGAMLAGVVACLIYLWMRMRRLFAPMLITLIIGASIFVVKYDAPMGTFNTRPAMWKMTIKTAMMQPITGYCLDSVRSGPVRYFMDKGTQKTVSFPRTEINLQTGGISYLLPPDLATRYDAWDNLHCEPIQLLYEFGVTGLILVGLLIWFARKMFLKTVKSNYICAVYCGMIALFIAGLTQFPFHLARIGYLLPLFGAMLYQEVNDA